MRVFTRLFLSYTSMLCEEKSEISLEIAPIQLKNENLSFNLWNQKRKKSA